jgi:glycogen operon protein
MAADADRRLIETGHQEPLGATPAEGGVNFAVYASKAARVELCLYDDRDNEVLRVDLPACTDGVWHGFMPGLAPGQRYGYRAHGAYDPPVGLRINAHKLLLDPYARAWSGKLSWSDAVFDYQRQPPDGLLLPSEDDSAAFVPKSVITAPGASPPSRRPKPWSETVIYELNVRGYTMLHPAVAEPERGTFKGLRVPAVIDHLGALGVTSVELLPIQAFVDEEFLVAKGLRNFWGYNTLGFFAPDPRFLAAGEIGEFKELVDALHDANIEVLLDVAYNHTAEGGKLGPTLSLRGLDNEAYYRLLPDDPSEYVNDTGCGNTLNTNHPAARRLVVDSLVYWATAMGVDGFRFDLATVLGRTGTAFEREHPLFAEIQEEPRLAGVKLIAEPWDVGPGGYQLGNFPRDWAEWNDRFRDGVRAYWRQDPHAAPELARRVHGSSDLFEASGRGPGASINFVACHDGFTTADLVSFAERHNEANLEDNRDGHGHNLSMNHGVEGPTNDADVLAARRRHRQSLLATLLFAQGTPMLLAGDELGNSQAGNNNAYCQDNAIGWLDWSGLAADPEFCASVRELIRLRRELPLLRQTDYRHGELAESTGRRDIRWFDTGGEPIAEAEWGGIASLGVLLSAQGDVAADGTRAVCVLYNAPAAPVEFRMPSIEAAGRWVCRYPGAAGRRLLSRDGQGVLVPGGSVVCLAYA